MNRSRRNTVQQLIRQGRTPKQAYDMTKLSRDLFAHAVWIKGALVRKDKTNGPQ